MKSSKIFSTLFALVLLSSSAMSRANSSSAHAGPDAVTALGWLKNGNSRYVHRRFRADGHSIEHRRSLEHGQHPHSIVLSCADSRVPAEAVFDQVEGEIFVTRVAGEALDSSVLASLEYAVEHLGPQLLVVLGHTHCGAVKAALGSNGKDAGSPSLNALVSDIKPRLKGITAKAASADLHVESLQNAKGIAADLSARSPILERAVKAGKLTIVPALYDIASGVVNFEKQ
jgi:carbonic anhydrase